MKKIRVLIVAGMMLVSAVGFAQDIPESQVPSLIVNNFKQAFSKASDVEWERKGDEYKVEFETDSFRDHEAWYDKTGKMVKHKQDISTNDLPETIQSSIKKDFSGYHIGDVEKMEIGSTITYKVELESASNEWKVVFDPNGKVLEKQAD